jgi:antirestriction protein ArdC
MGGAYLFGEAGASSAVIENQAVYVVGWLKKLRSNARLVIHAATQVQHAADYITQIEDGSGLFGRASRGR